MRRVNYGKLHRTNFALFLYLFKHRSLLVNEFRRKKKMYLNFIMSRDWKSNERMFQKRPTELTNSPMIDEYELRHVYWLSFLHSFFIVQRLQFNTKINFPNSATTRTGNRYTNQTSWLQFTIVVFFCYFYSNNVLNFPVLLKYCMNQLFPLYCYPSLHRIILFLIRYFNIWPRPIHLYRFDLIDSIRYRPFHYQKIFVSN